jgi:glutathione S-transferase
MLKIWGRISSINVRKVVLAAQLLELEFERIDAGATFGVVRTPEYMAKNFNALVPMLEDGDYSLWESNVIVRYLGARHGNGKFYPEPLRERFDAERWMDWQQTTLNPAGREAFIQLIRTPAERRSQSAIDASVQATEALMTQLDAHLAERAFMVGDTVTMADVPIACEIHRWWGLPLDRPARPHLARWYGHITSLPAARGVLDLTLS